MLWGARTVAFCFSVDACLTLPSNQQAGSRVSGIFFQKRAGKDLAPCAKNKKARHSCLSRGRNLQIPLHVLLFPLPSLCTVWAIIMGKGYWREGNIFWEKSQTIILITCLNIFLGFPLFPQYSPLQYLLFILFFYFYSLFPLLLPALSFIY